MDIIGFICNAFVQLIIFCFTSSGFLLNVSLVGFILDFIPSSKFTICTVFCINICFCITACRSYFYGCCLCPNGAVVHRREQHGGGREGGGGYAHAGVRGLGVGLGVLGYDDIAVLGLAPDDFEDSVHKLHPLSNYS